MRQFLFLAFYFSYFCISHLEGHNPPNSEHTANDIHTGSLAWMNDIYYFPYEDYASYYFYYDIDHFGDFYLLDAELGKIYHPRSASQWYVYGESGDGFYMYGPNYECWVWTSKDAFPWMYVHTSNNGVILSLGWARLSYIEVRPDDNLWSQMVFPETGYDHVRRVRIPF